MEGELKLRREVERLLQFYGVADGTTANAVGYTRRPDRKGSRWLFHSTRTEKAMIAIVVRWSGTRWNRPALARLFGRNGVIVATVRSQTARKREDLQCKQ